MKKTIVVYGSTTGSCQEFAEQIAQKLGVNDVVNVSDVDADKLGEFDNLLLGTSTWGAGELQDDWYDGVEMLKSADLSGKTVALFGCGDADGYGDTFCGGMAELYNAVKDSGAKLVGQVDAGTYNYDDSEAVVDGKFVGLALDCSESQGKSENRIDEWLDSIKSEL
jgi:flavodoxin I